MFSIITTLDESHRIAVFVISRGCWTEKATFSVARVMNRLEQLRVGIIDYNKRDNQLDMKSIFYLYIGIQKVLL